MTNIELLALLAQEAIKYKEFADSRKFSFVERSSGASLFSLDSQGFYARELYISKEDFNICTKQKGWNAKDINLEEALETGFLTLIEKK